MVSDDEVRIRALIHAYCERLDAGDLDGVAALFAHGTCKSPRGTELTGTAEVRRMYDAVIRYPDGTPRTKHVLGTLVVDVDPVANMATARSAFTVFQQAPGGRLRPVLAGRYHDRFTRADGAWRFEERMVRPDLEGDLSQHMQPR